MFIPFWCSRPKSSTNRRRRRFRHLVFGRPYAESVELMKNRQLDATLQSSGLGMAAFRDLASTMSVRFIPVPADVVAAIGSPPIGPASSPPTPKTSVARDTRSAVSRMPRGALRQVPRYVARGLHGMVMGELTSGRRGTSRAGGRASLALVGDADAGRGRDRAWAAAGCRRVHGCR